MGLGLNIGIDLGTATVLIYVHGRVLYYMNFCCCGEYTHGKSLGSWGTCQPDAWSYTGYRQGCQTLRDGAISDFL